MDMLDKLLEKIERMLDEISVEKYENVKRMGAVMDAVKDMRKAIAAAKKEGEAHEGHDQQG